jgi:Spy/CpxP family protein refolding chaperone
MTRKDSDRSPAPIAMPAQAGRPRRGPWIPATKEGQRRNRRAGSVCRIGSLLPALFLALAVPAGAQPGLGAGPGLRGRIGGPPFLQQLFRPELVMKHQRDIKLTDEQRAKITEAIKTTQGKVLELQWKMEDEQQKLTELLEAERINADTALAQADVVMDTERKVKKEHLTLLIQIKNLLTPEQQKTLREKSQAKKRRPGPPQ